ncbi:MAG: hypothetical protein QG673_1061, partial [Pseudomonadota bacterium]|nr:hypothetical protein [Pseudomonadota bacterium]
MNSGDRFFASDTLELLSNFISPDRQLIYGKVEVRRNNGLKYIKNYRNLSRLQLKYGMPFCHQSLLVRSDLMKQHKYEATKYIAADYNFIVDCYVKGCDFYAIPLVIASISAHGISDNCRAAVLSDWCEIAQKIAPGISTKLYYKVIILRERMKGMIKQILPASLLDIIYRRLCS